MARFAKLMAFVASGFLLCADSPSARADLYLIALDGSDETVKPEEYGYEVTTSSAGNKVTIRFVLTDKAARSFQYGYLTLKKNGTTVVQTTLALEGLQRTPDNKRFLVITFSTDVIDDGEVVLWSKEVEGQPDPLYRRWGGFGGFRVSIKTLLARAKAEDKPAKKSMPVAGPDDRQQRVLSLLRSWRSAPDDSWERTWGTGPVVLRGKLVRTGDGSTFFTKERKQRQTGDWALEARLGSDVVWVPLVGVAADEKRLDAAEELAGKEVVLTGKAVIATAHLQLVESQKYPAVSVESLRLAEPPAEKKTGEPKPAADPEQTLFKVEVRGRLHITAKLRRIQELESPPNIHSPAYAIDKTAIETGAAIETRQMGNMEVYFGGEEQLQEKARSLNGKTVILSGSLERVTFYAKQDKYRDKLLGGSEGTDVWVERPALITKSTIRVDRLEGVEQPTPSQPAPHKKSAPLPDWKAFENPAEVLLTDAFAESVKGLPAAEKTAAIQRLNGLLKSESVETRRRAALTLAALGDRSGVPTMIDDLSASTGRDRENVVIALRILKDERAIPALRKALKDKSPHVRGFAATALGELKAAKAYDEIVALTKDKEGLQVSKGNGQLNCTPYCPAFSACYALGDLGDERAIPVLIGLLEDVDLRGPARHALEVLTKQKLGNDPEKWKAWWKSKG